MNSRELEALSTAEYWNERYANKDSHEWFKSYSSLATFFKMHLFSSRPLHSRLLHLGSGDSKVPVELAKHGYRNQLCVDFSSVIVQQMATAEATYLGIEWKQADVRNMKEVPDSSIDVALDKGTLDAMIHGSPWSPPDDVVDNSRRYMDEVWRVLKDDGLFLYITYRQPHFIKPLVNANQQWNLANEVLTDGESTFDYHAFIMSKAKALG